MLLVDFTFIQKIKGMSFLFVVYSTLIISAYSCSEKSDSDNIKPPVVVMSDDLLGTSPLPPSSEQIERIAWCGVQYDQLTRKRFDEFKKCGLTINYNLYQNAAQLEQVLNFSQEVGIKTILHSEETQPNHPKLAESIIRFKNHPALYGYAIMDEPQRNVNNFTGTIDEAIAHGKAVRALDPNEDHILYITNNYIPLVDIEYLDAGIDRKILSFDYYPTWPYSIAPANYNYWFLATETEANHARKLGKKWWGFAVTAKHLSYPAATVANLRAQVFVNLAYGAQGIEYFTYSVPKGTTDYTHTPVNANGDTTEFYTQLKNINSEIMNLSFVFANSTVEWTQHYNYQKDDPAVTPTVTSKKPVILPSQVKKVQTSLPVLMSLISKSGDNYLVVVNRDFEKNIDAYVEFEPTVKRILKTGVAVNTEQHIIIRPGDALIYTWKK
jgi:hypothetical protein